MDIRIPISKAGGITFFFGIKKVLNEKDKSLNSCIEMNVSPYCQCTVTSSLTLLPPYLSHNLRFLSELIKQNKLFLP